MQHHFSATNKKLTIGLEVELQIIDPTSYDLAPRAKDLIRTIRTSRYEDLIKPEITQSMIEINSSIHQTPQTLHREMIRIGRFLQKESEALDFKLCGGGTHLFQNWSGRKIFPTARFKNVSNKYRYLAKRFTVFSMHVHIGCNHPNDAVYLTHILSRYVPQFIALSASSPFYQGIYTGYHSSRVNVVNAFPLSGHCPLVKSWYGFSKYFTKMRELKIIGSMKDFYWDVRPKPEFGTVEIRICDMPLKLSRSIAIVAYLQSLVSYLLHEKPYDIHEDLYHVYEYNRFNASRYGYDADFINPFTLTHRSLQKDILSTIDKIEPYAKELNNGKYLYEIYKLAVEKENDAKYLRILFDRHQSLPKVVNKACQIWDKSFKIRAD